MLIFTYWLGPRVKDIKPEVMEQPTQESISKELRDENTINTI